MAVKIKLQRIGKIRTPHYRVVIADARTRRSGRVIENIGTYEPKAEPSVIKIDSERAQHWLSVGAQPTEQVLALLKLTGDWAKFKGEGSTESTVKPVEGKPEFQVPEKDSVVIPEAITPKSEEKAPAAESSEEKAEEAETSEESAE